MITLYGFQPLWGLTDISSFVSKVETYLRMVEILYQLKPYPFLEIGNAPKGKLPFIDDGDTRVADSTFIIEHLERTRGCSLDDHLSPGERAIAYGLRVMMEEHLYWATMQVRWRIDDNWKSFMNELFGDFPDQDMLAGVLPKVREAVLQSMSGHGMGRHSVDEVWRLGQADLSALSDFLADKPYFMGERPSTLDATAYAFITGARAGYDSPLRQHIDARANLTDYCERMRARYYSD
ncbi:MAG: glutathione S-transferase family protein [Haliangiales bacterium]